MIRFDRIPIHATTAESGQKVPYLEISGEDEPIAILLNGFGFTAVLELCIVMKEIKAYTQKHHIQVYHADMMNVFCPQGTGGFSISVMKLDEELKPYYDYKADSPLYKREQL